MFVCVKTSEYLVDSGMTGVNGRDMVDSVCLQSPSMKFFMNLKSC